MTVTSTATISTHHILYVVECVFHRSMNYLLCLRLILRLLCIMVRFKLGVTFLLWLLLQQQQATQCNDVDKNNDSDNNNNKIINDKVSLVSAEEMCICIQKCVKGASLGQSVLHFIFSTRSLARSFVCSFSISYVVQRYLFNLFFFLSLSPSLALSSLLCLLFRGFL